MIRMSKHPRLLMETLKFQTVFSLYSNQFINKETVKLLLEEKSFQEKTANSNED